MGHDSPTSEVDKTVKKYKRRIKKICICGIVWTLLAILSLIIGIVMLVHFSKYWGKEDWQSGLVYFGVALLILFVASLVIGILFFVILRILYKRLEAPEKHMKMFKPPNYVYGEAPYPQQPVPSQPNQPSQPPASQLLQPGAMPTAPHEGKLEDVSIEVSGHDKF